MILNQFFNKDLSCLEYGRMKSALIDLVAGKQGTCPYEPVIRNLQQPLLNDNAPFPVAPDPVNQNFRNTLVGNLICFPPVPVIQL